MKFAFENFKELFLENERITAGSKPFKLLSTSQNLEKSYKTLLNAGLCAENLFQDAVFDDGKLMLSELDEKGNEKTEEVKYFGSTNNADSKDNVLYQVKRNPDHSVIVTSSGLYDQK